MASDGGASSTGSDCAVASASAMLLVAILLSSNLPHRKLSLAKLGSCPSIIAANLPRLTFLSVAIANDFRTDCGKSSAFVLGERYGEDGASNFALVIMGEWGSPSSGSVPLTCDDTDDVSGILESSSAFPIWIGILVDGVFTVDIVRSETLI